MRQRVSQVPTLSPTSLKSMFVNPLHQRTVTDIALLDVEYDSGGTDYAPSS